MVIDHKKFLAKAMKQSCLAAKTIKLGKLFKSRAVEELKYQEN